MMISTKDFSNVLIEDLIASNGNGKYITFFFSLVENKGWYVVIKPEWAESKKVDSLEEAIALYNHG